VGSGDALTRNARDIEFLLNGIDEVLHKLVRLGKPGFEKVLSEWAVGFLNRYVG
jgi:hypothetical protein